MELTSTIISLLLLSNFSLVVCTFHVSLVNTDVIYTTQNEWLAEHVVLENTLNDTSLYIIKPLSENCVLKYPDKLYTTEHTNTTDISICFKLTSEKLGLIGFEFISQSNELKKNIYIPIQTIQSKTTQYFYNNESSVPVPYIIHNAHQNENCSVELLSYNFIGNNEGFVRHIGDTVTQMAPNETMKYFIYCWHRNKNASSEVLINIRLTTSQESFIYTFEIICQRKEIREIFKMEFSGNPSKTIEVPIEFQFDDTVLTHKGISHGCVIDDNSDKYVALYSLYNDFALSFSTTYLRDIILNEIGQETYDETKNNYLSRFQLPFNFKFYDDEYETINIHPQGFVTFSDLDINVISPNNIKNSLQPNNIIAPLLGAYDNTNIHITYGYVTEVDKNMVTGVYVKWKIILEETKSIEFMLYLFETGVIFFRYNFNGHFNILKDRMKDKSVFIAGVEDKFGIRRTLEPISEFFESHRHNVLMFFNLKYYFETPNDGILRCSLRLNQFYIPALSTLDVFSFLSDSGVSYKRVHTEITNIGVHDFNLIETEIDLFCALREINIHEITLTNTGTYSLNVTVHANPANNINMKIYYQNQINIPRKSTSYKFKIGIEPLHASTTLNITFMPHLPDSPVYTYIREIFSIEYDKFALPTIDTIYGGLLHAETKVKNVDYRIMTLKYVSEIDGIGIDILEPQFYTKSVYPNQSNFISFNCRKMEDKKIYFLLQVFANLHSHIIGMRVEASCKPIIKNEIEQISLSQTLPTYIELFFSFVSHNPTGSSVLICQDNIVAEQSHYVTTVLNAKYDGWTSAAVFYEATYGENGMELPPSYTEKTCLFGACVYSIYTRFEFRFYGVKYTKIFISSNGFLSFDYAGMYNADPYAILSDVAPNNMIGCLVTNFYSTGTVRIASRHNRVHIQWHNYKIEADKTVSCEVILNNMGLIFINHYGESFPSMSYSGIENKDGSSRTMTDISITNSRRTVIHNHGSVEHAVGDIKHIHIVSDMHTQTNCHLCVGIPTNQEGGLLHAEALTTKVYINEPYLYESIGAFYDTTNVISPQEFNISIKNIGGGVLTARAVKPFDNDNPLKVDCYTNESIFIEAQTSKIVTCTYSTNVEGNLSTYVHIQTLNNIGEWHPLTLSSILNINVISAKDETAYRPELKRNTIQSMPNSEFKGSILFRRKIDPNGKDYIISLNKITPETRHVYAITENVLIPKDDAYALFGIGSSLKELDTVYTIEFVISSYSAFNQTVSCEVNFSLLDINYNDKYESFGAPPVQIYDTIKLDNIQTIMSLYIFYNNFYFDESMQYNMINKADSELLFNEIGDGYIPLDPFDSTVELPKCTKSSCKHEIELPFTFNFFDRFYNTLLISSNGYVQFPPFSDNISINDPLILLSNIQPNNIISPGLSDYDASNPRTKIRYLFRNSAIIIEWMNMETRHKNENDACIMNFQLHLRKDSKIFIEYGSQINIDSCSFGYGVKSLSGKSITSIVMKQDESKPDMDMTSKLIAYMDVKIVSEGSYNIPYFFELDMFEEKFHTVDIYAGDIYQQYLSYNHVAIQSKILDPHLVSNHQEVYKFDELLNGDSVTESFTLSNIGGGISRVSLDVNGPIKTILKLSIRDVGIIHNEEVVVSITCQSHTSGVYEGSVVIVSFQQYMSFNVSCSFETVLIDEDNNLLGEMNPHGAIAGQYTEISMEFANAGQQFITYFQIRNNNDIIGNIGLYSDESITQVEPSQKATLKVACQYPAIATLKHNFTLNVIQETDFGNVTEEFNLPVVCDVSSGLNENSLPDSIDKYGFVGTTDYDVFNLENKGSTSIFVRFRANSEFKNHFGCYNKISGEPIRWFPAFVEVLKNETIPILGICNFTYSDHLDGNDSISSDIIVEHKYSEDEFYSSVHKFPASCTTLPFKSEPNIIDALVEPNGMEVCYKLRPLNDSNAKIHSLVSPVTGPTCSAILDYLLIDIEENDYMWINIEDEDYVFNNTECDPYICAPSLLPIYNHPMKERRGHLTVLPSGRVRYEHTHYDYVNELDIPTNSYFIGGETRIIQKPESKLYVKVTYNELIVTWKDFLIESDKQDISCQIVIVKSGDVFFNFESNSSIDFGVRGDFENVTHNTPLGSGHYSALLATEHLIDSNFIYDDKPPLYIERRMHSHTFKDTEAFTLELLINNTHPIDGRFHITTFLNNDIIQSLLPVQVSADTPVKKKVLKIIVGALGAAIFVVLVILIGVYKSGKKKVTLAVREKDSWISVNNDNNDNNDKPYFKKTHSSMSSDRLNIPPPQRDSWM